MSWHLLQNKEQIRRIIEYLIDEQIEINVRIEKEGSKYSSRFIEVVPGANGGDVAASSDQTPELVMDKLVPERGNSLIREFPRVGVEALTTKYLCRCHTKYVRVPTAHPYYGLIVSFPEFLELEEKRREERITVEFPDVLSAVFELAVGPEKDQSYELNILNYSDHGLGLLVPEKDFGLLQMLGPGDRISEITILAKPGLMHMDGIVRHKTKIKDGRHKENYVLGLESNTGIGAIINEVSSSQ